MDAGNSTVSVGYSIRNAINSFFVFSYRTDPTRAMGCAISTPSPRRRSLHGRQDKAFMYAVEPTSVKTPFVLGVLFCATVLGKQFFGGGCDVM